MVPVTHIFHVNVTPDETGSRHDLNLGPCYLFNKPEASCTQEIIEIIQ